MKIKSKLFTNFTEGVFPVLLILLLGIIHPGEVSSQEPNSVFGDREINESNHNLLVLRLCYDLATDLIEETVDQFSKATYKETYIYIYPACRPGVLRKQLRSSLKHNENVMRMSRWKFPLFSRRYLMMRSDPNTYSFVSYFKEKGKVEVVTLTSFLEVMNN